MTVQGRIIMELHMKKDQSDLHNLPERALIMKLTYENQSNVVATLRAFRCRKKLSGGPMSPQNVTNMISRLEEPGSLYVQHDRKRKSISAEVISEITTAVVQ
ncbi:hypothetical protein NPIL_502471 [Nephila pilipes]|uniref:DUF4817 domain-containing protein n=1 Tax=Nephila pilipes TaxID=299642 RepID=A0A8X6PEH2_NEPPI|nr:hypothetical protein NPIL_502471 [Nephila pilipes]